MSREDEIRLRHVADAAREAASFAAGRARGDLDTDRQLVTRNGAGEGDRNRR